jgi:hypothetical protein
VAISQWILGIRPSTTACASTRACPRIGAASPSRAGSAAPRYNITVHKAKGSAGRVARLTVDGRRFAGNLIPLPTRPGQSFDVEAFVQ